MTDYTSKTPTRVTISLRLPVESLTKLNQIQQKRGDTFRETTLVAFLEAYGDHYLSDLPEHDDENIAW